MKWKFSTKQIPIASLLLLLFFATSIKVQASTVIAQGSNFNLYFGSGSGLAFQHLESYPFSAFTASVTVQSGTLNGTNAVLNMMSTQGTLRFTSQSTAILVPSKLMQIEINEKIHREPATIQNGDKVVLSWSAGPYEPAMPLMFIVGMIGLGATFTGPMYCVHKCKHGEYREALVTGVTVTAIGLALFIAWLW